jgi:hypothetical protein
MLEPSHPTDSDFGTIYDDLGVEIRRCLDSCERLIQQLRSDDSPRGAATTVGDLRKNVEGALALFALPVKNTIRQGEPKAFAGIIEASYCEIVISLSMRLVALYNVAMEKATEGHESWETLQWAIKQCEPTLGFDPCFSKDWLQAAVTQEIAACNSQATQRDASDLRGQRDTEKGQNKRRPLNERATACLAEFNRRRDRGEQVKMAAHCRDFCKEAGDFASVYRTLKDYSDLWHVPAMKGDK